MKRYERVELQYNINNARAQLLNDFANFDGFGESKIQNVK
jgi:hypothetical protein